MSYEVMGPDAMILVFLMLSFFKFKFIYFNWRLITLQYRIGFAMLSFKPTFSLSSFTFIKRLFSSSLLSAIRVVSSG